jgi:hypothetical protein
MLRHLYRCAVRLHPSSFRERFGDEMLYIFDQQRGTLAAFGLLLDSFLSVLRQWTLRLHLGIGLTTTSAVQNTSNGAPSFATLDNFRPRTSAIVHGMVLSIILFCTTVYAIRYSWIHVVNLRILESVFHPNQEISPSTNTNYFSSSSPEPIAPGSEKSRLLSDHLQVDVLPVEREDIVGIEEFTSRHPHNSAVLTPLLVQLRLETYVGKYLSKSPPLKISIGIEGDHLSLIVAGSPRRALSPVSQTKFVIAGAENGWIDFTPDNRGRIDSLCLVEQDKIIVAYRQ